MLDAWMTWASMPRALSQRASQKPSRPASKATAMRVILWPAAAAASARQRPMGQREKCVPVLRKLLEEAGVRHPGHQAPPMSQPDWLISTTAISVLSISRTVRDRLRSFGLCCVDLRIGGSICWSLQDNDGCKVLAVRPIAS